MVRLARLAAGQGGTVQASDVEQDDLLVRDRGMTSAAARLLASGTNVITEPTADPAHWFPYARLTFIQALDDIGRKPPER